MVIYSKTLDGAVCHLYENSYSLGTRRDFLSLDAGFLEILNGSTESGEWQNFASAETRMLSQAKF